MFTEAQWSKIDKLLNCIRVFNSDLEETSNIYILSISFHLQYTYFSIFLSLTTGKMANIIGLAENQIVKPAENYSPLSKNLILSHDPVLLILIMINNIESVGKKIYDLDGDQLDFLQVHRVTPKGMFKRR
jgi:hypothetical protein